MNSKHIAILSVLLVVGFSAPAASAWTSAGQVEPSSPLYDVADYMEQGYTAGDVYFNAFTQNTLLLDQNPNNGVTQSSVWPTPLMFLEALLGVWTDCNGDGVIGAADGAVARYPAAALTVPGFTVSNNCPVGPHNDGEWVAELIHVGFVDPCDRESEAVRNDASHMCFGAPEFIPQPFVIYTDEPIQMWADQGAPDEPRTGTVKLENDVTYTFFNGGPDDRDAEQQIINMILGENTPGSFGVGALEGTGGSMWFGNVVYVSTPQSISRQTLLPSSRAYWSNYVSVSSDWSTLGLETPAGPAGTYGSPFCGFAPDATTPDAGGWVCNPGEWWTDGNGDTRQTYRYGTDANADGTVTNDERIKIGVKPGQSYEFRDVDCYDGTLVKGVFVRASLTDLSPSGICDGSAPLPP